MAEGGRALTRHSPGTAEASAVELLRETLRYAVGETAYYAVAYRGIDLDLQSLDDLGRIPLLTRATVAAAGPSLLARGVAPEYVGITSGTTFGRTNKIPLLHYHSAEEREIGAELMDRLLDLHAHHGNLRPLTLRLLAANHGLGPNSAQRGTFALPLEKFYHFHAILGVLRQAFSFDGFTPRVHALVSTLNLLKLLTLLCIENGIDSSDFAIRSIGAGGWQLTTRWKRLLEDYWRAPVTEIYGLSEVAGMTASRCRHCGHYHFSPLAIVEVLGVDHDRPVTSGVGRLVATALYPLAQAQPMIRYDTSDLVEIEPECAARPGLAFEYIGRAENTVLVPGPQGPAVAVGPIALNEIIDSVPDIATAANPRAKNIPLNMMFGWQKYALHRTPAEGAEHLVLQIELSWSPSQYPDQARRFRSDLHDRLLRELPTLAGAVERDAVTFAVELAEPGSTKLAAVC